ncbi:MAG: M14 family metallopeptidase [Planctomycetes bacterium]|nr:M14 family metallopeptidase [Planctomycetota bacterium]
MFASLLVPVLAMAMPQSADTSPTTDEALLTVAERTAFRKTAAHADVVALLDALAARTPNARRLSMGQTEEGRDIPLLVLADPPVASADEARASGKVVVLAFANIHAGEVCGKEALPMLAREMIEQPTRADVAPLWEQLVLVLAPIFNGDGNDRFASDNRPEQVGPDEMGTRENARGLDINRDYVKLESKEARAMVRFLTEWDPHLVIDLHTTNGSFHRYQLTYSPPLNPAGPTPPLALVRDRMLPEVSDRLLRRTGLRTFPYGNFDDDKTKWSTYSPEPRFGAQYHGLRGHLSVLSEAYSHIPFEDRVVVTREFVRECLLWAAEHATRVREAVVSGASEVRHAAGNGLPVGVRHALEAAPGKATLLGWVETVDADGKRAPTDEPHDYEVLHEDHFAPTLGVPRPAGYLVPPELTGVLELLAAHGIKTHRLDDSVAAPGARWPLEVPCEEWLIGEVTRAEHEFQGHRTVSVQAERVPVRRRVTGDWFAVPLQQRLGTLALYLLEPLSEDGLLTWNVFDDVLAPGEAFPVLRVPEKSPLLER